MGLRKGPQLGPIMPRGVSLSDRRNFFFLGLEKTTFFSGTWKINIFFWNLKKINIFYGTFFLELEKNKKKPSTSSTNSTHEAAQDWGCSPSSSWHRGGRTRGFGSGVCTCSLPGRPFSVTPTRRRQLKLFYNFLFNFLFINFFF